MLPNRVNQAVLPTQAGIFRFSRMSRDCSMDLRLRRGRVRGKAHRPGRMAGHEVNHSAWPASVFGNGRKTSPTKSGDGSLYSSKTRPGRKREAAQVDAIVDYIEDAAKGMMAHRQEKYESKKDTLKQTFLKEFLPSYLQTLERKLDENNEGRKFFVGTKPSWGDFYVVVMLDNVIGMDSAILNKYPGLKARNQRVHEPKGIKEWITKRPNTQN